MNQPYTKEHYNFDANLIPVGENDSLWLKIYHRMRFVLLHVVTLIGCFMVELQIEALYLCLTLYFVRMFGFLGSASINLRNLMIKLSMVLVLG